MIVRIFLALAFLVVGVMVALTGLRSVRSAV